MPFPGVERAGHCPPRRPLGTAQLRHLFFTQCWPHLGFIPVLWWGWLWTLNFVSIWLFDFQTLILEWHPQLALELMSTLYNLTKPSFRTWGISEPPSMSELGVSPLGNSACLVRVPWKEKITLVNELKASFSPCLKACTERSFLGQN